MVEVYPQKRPSWYEIQSKARDRPTVSAGVSGVIGRVFHRGTKFSVELYISADNKKRNERIFAVLKQERTQIGEDVGVESGWMPQKRDWRIKQSEDIHGTSTRLTADQQGHLVGWMV